MTIADFAELYDSKDTFNAEESGLGSTLFEGYIIYRPSRAFKNINLLAQRYITESVLADDEKEALSALTPEDWKEAGRPINLTGVAPWFYGSIGVNLTGENLTRYLGDATVFNLRDIFWYSEDGSTAAGTWTQTPGFRFPGKACSVPSAPATW